MTHEEAMLYGRIAEALETIAGKQVEKVDLLRLSLESQLYSAELQRQQLELMRSMYGKVDPEPKYAVPLVVPNAAVELAKESLANEVIDTGMIVNYTTEAEALRSAPFDKWVYEFESRATGTTLYAFVDRPGQMAGRNKVGMLRAPLTPDVKS